MCRTESSLVGSQETQTEAQRLWARKLRQKASSPRNPSMSNASKYVRLHVQFDVSAYMHTALHWIPLEASLSSKA